MFRFLCSFHRRRLFWPILIMLFAGNVLFTMLKNGPREKGGGNSKKNVLEGIYLAICGQTSKLTRTLVGDFLHQMRIHCSTLRPTST